MTAPQRPYDRLLRPISLSDAHVEPADDLFVEPLASGHPRIIISTTIEAEGHTLNVTFHDTPIDQVLAILRRQSQPARPGRDTPAAPRRRRQRRTPPAPPRYSAVWSDFADEPSERGAQIVATAADLLELGMASCWSNAIAQARQSR